MAGVVCAAAMNKGGVGVCSSSSCPYFNGSWGENHSHWSVARESSVGARRVGVGNGNKRGSGQYYKPIIMKNVNEGKGVFAPIVIVTRNLIGKRTFNQIRGKAIALHSQVITEFCKSIGADGKQRQGLIRLAKKNGEWLGFLA